MTDPRRWLEGRSPAPPESLRLAMADALDRTAGPGPGGDGGLADRLADAALAALARVLALPSTREHALALLAADALLTYAFEAAAEEGGDAVRRLADRLGAARFDQLLEEGAPA